MNLLYISRPKASIFSPADGLCAEQNGFRLNVGNDNCGGPLPRPKWVCRRLHRLEGCTKFELLVGRPAEGGADSPESGGNAR